MPWCPICKNEYREGFTTCAECNVQLVASITDIPVAIYFGSQKELDAMVKFLQDNGFEEANMSYDEKEDVYELFVKSENEKSAKRILECFISEMEEKRIEDACARAEITDSEQEEVPFCEELRQFQMDAEEKKAIPGVYQDKQEKAEEYKSSASALLIVGVLGIAAIIINEMGVLPFTLSFHKPMVYGVMGTVFALFIIFGIYSLIHYKKLLKQADAEDDVAKQMKDYLNTHFSKEQMLSDEKSEGKGEEQLYFIRTAKMKSQLMKQFTDADEALVEKLVDDHYDECFS